jgi:predicted transcriptional regulator
MKINGKAFKDARESLMMSVTEVAKKALVSGAVIRKLEDSQPARPELVRRVIEALGKSVDEARERGYFEL